MAIAGEATSTGALKAEAIAGTTFLRYSRPANLVQQAGTGNGGRVSAELAARLAA